MRDVVPSSLWIGNALDARDVKFTANRFDVEREVTCGGTVPLRILGGQEVSQMRMVVPVAPTPALGKFQIETDADLIRGFEQASDRRRTFHA